MPYTAKAVHLDGATCLDCPNINAPNSNFYSVSFWAKNWLGAPGQSGCFLVIDPDNFYWSIINGQGGKPCDPMFLFIDLAYDNAVITQYPDPEPVYESAWHHVLMTVDTNAPAGQKIFKLYIDDIDISGTYPNFEDNNNPFIMANDQRPVRVLGDGIADYSVGDFADIWIAPGVSLLTGGDIPEATRRIFISSEGLPQDPMGFPPSAMLFSGGASTFWQNQGSGGSFTVLGALIDSDSSPSIPYHAKAVHFDGQTWMKNPSVTGGDDIAITISGWFKLYPTSPNSAFAVIDPEGGYWSNFNLHGSGGYAFNLKGEGFGQTAELNISDPPGTGPFTPGQWHHILYSGHVGAGSGGRKVALYIDDVKVTPTQVVDTGTYSFNIVTIGLPFWFGNDGSSSGIIMDCADVWIIPGLSLINNTPEQIIPVNSRRLFISSWLGPQDPSIALDFWGPQTFQFWGDKDHFWINQGTGGPFQLIGQLTDASDSPSGHPPILVQNLDLPVGITKITTPTGMTYVLTDMSNTSVAVAVDVDPVLGNMVTFGGESVQQQSTMPLVQLMLQLSTGLVP
jgi:hypothetical protein